MEPFRFLLRLDRRVARGTQTLKLSEEHPIRSLLKRCPFTDWFDVVCYLRRRYDPFRTAVATCAFDAHLHARTLCPTLRPVPVLLVLMRHRFPC
jgi:hypothetical protein